MTWWMCFVCGSNAECSHREPELRLWMRSLAVSAAEADRERYLRALEPDEPARLQSEFFFPAEMRVQ